MDRMHRATSTLLQRHPGAQGALMHLAVVGVSMSMNAARVFPSFRDALRNARMTVQFRSGGAARRLIIHGTTIQTRPGTARRPDYEVELIDLQGAIEHLRQDPDDLLGLLVTNKVSGRGNTYYLFQLGYLANELRSCLERSSPRAAAV